MTSEDTGNIGERRIALVVEYDGTDYAGFQWQAHSPTIQQELESAIVTLTGVPTRIRGASRTDSGAHASGQVVDFATDSGLEPAVFVPALNYHLPDAIRVVNATETPGEFHSRYSASHREYRYNILNRRIASPLLRRTHHLETTPLNLERMNQAASSLLGIRDFRRLSAGHSVDRSAVRRVLNWSVSRSKQNPDEIAIDCAANGFLRYQIRRANAVLVDIGKGKLPIHAMADALSGRTQNRHHIHTLPARGLCLKRVHYPGYDHLLKVKNYHETN